MKETFRGGWATVNKLTLDQVTDLIVTGRTAEQAKPDTWAYNLLGDAEKPTALLDFGCGMGRNSLGLANHFKNWTIVGYDSDGMIEKSREYAALKYNNEVPNNLWFISDWEQLKLHKFDVIMCMIVLQHIYEEDLAKYAQDFKKMTKFLFVSGRRFNDDKRNRSTWTILEEQGLVPDKFFAGHEQIPFTPEGDPGEHNAAYYYL